VNLASRCPACASTTNSWNSTVVDKPDVFVLSAADDPDLPQARRSGLYVAASRNSGSGGFSRAQAEGITEALKEFDTSTLVTLATSLLSVFGAEGCRAISPMGCTWMLVGGTMYQQWLQVIGLVFDGAGFALIALEWYRGYVEMRTRVTLVARDVERFEKFRLKKELKDALGNAGVAEVGPLLDNDEALAELESASHLDPAQTLYRARKEELLKLMSPRSTR